MHAGTFTIADEVVIDMKQSFAVTVRSGQGPQHLFLAGTIPKTSPGAVQIQDNGYSLLSLPQGGRIPLQSSGLVSAGFTGGTRQVQSDSVRMDPDGDGSFSAIYWYHTASGSWVDADGNVATPNLDAGESLLIHRRNRGSSVSWSPSLPYNVPLEVPE